MSLLLKESEIPILSFSFSACSMAEAARPAGLVIKCLRLYTSVLNFGQKLILGYLQTKLFGGRLLLRIKLYRQNESDVLRPTHFANWRYLFAAEISENIINGENEIHLTFILDTDFPSRQLSDNELHS